MPNSPDQSESRVIQLMPHLHRKRVQSTRKTQRTELLLDDASADRLVRIDAAMPSIEGEHDGVEHLTALGLGVSSGAFYPIIATEDAPAAARALGFSEMEIMLQCIGEYDADFARLVASNAIDAGVHIRSVHTLEHYHQVLSVYPRRAAEGHEMMDRAIDFAATVGAGILVWHGPPRSHIATSGDWERFIRETRAIATRCTEQGITLAIENVSRCALATVRDVTAFARAISDIPAEALGFVFDPFQAAEAGANPFMMLAAMGNRVVNVHISDWLESDPTQRHLPPGDGDLPWAAITRAIAGSGYAGPLVIEGAMGEGESVANRIRETMEPLIRAVFPFPPRGSKEVPAPTELPLGVRKGIQLFNQRKFYEQHEMIEHEWHAERSPIRALYQGILQIGVGFHHVLNGNHKGALTLLRDGTEKVSQFTPEALGVDTGRLLSETRACIDQIETLGDANISAFDADLIPEIHTASPE